MITSLEAVDRLLYIIADRMVPAATVKYYNFKTVANPPTEFEIGEDVDLIRSVMVEGRDAFAKKATTAAEEYLTTFRVNSSDIDFFKFGYFICVSLSEDGTLEPHQKKIAKMMGVLLLDGLLAIDNGAFAPKEFSTKMCFSIFNGSADEHYGKYGIYTAFKLASKSFRKT